MNINYLNHTLVKLYLTPSERICFSKEDLICTVCNVLIRFSERGMYYSGEIGSGYILTCEEQQIKNIIE